MMMQPFFFRIGGQQRYLLRRSFAECNDFVVVAMLQRVGLLTVRTLDGGLLVICLLLQCIRRLTVPLGL